MDSKEHVLVVGIQVICHRDVPDEPCKQVKTAPRFHIKRQQGIIRIPRNGIHLYTRIGIRYYHVNIFQFVSRIRQRGYIEWQRITVGNGQFHLAIFKMVFILFLAIIWIRLPQVQRTMTGPRIRNTLNLIKHQGNRINRATRITRISPSSEHCKAIILDFCVINQIRSQLPIAI